MKLRGIAAELKDKIDSCNSPEEVLELAKKEGYELTDEELEVISGGGWGGEKKYRVECQHCHQIFEAPQSWLGCWVHCPLCGTEIWITPAS